MRLKLYINKVSRKGCGMDALSETKKSDIEAKRVGEGRGLFLGRLSAFVIGMKVGLA